MSAITFQQLTDAIRAGAEFRYNLPFGCYRIQNPLRAEERNGQLYLIFTSRRSGEIKRKLEACVAVTSNDAGRFVASLQEQS